MRASKLVKKALSNCDCTILHDFYSTKFYTSISVQCVFMCAPVHKVFLVLLYVWSSLSYSVPVGVSF